MSAGLLRFSLTVLGVTAVETVLGAVGRYTAGTCPLRSTWWRGALCGTVLGLLAAFSARAA